MDALERTRIRQLLDTCKRHLHELALQRAAMGLHTPPHINTQIADYEREIAGLEQQLATLLPLHNLPPRDYERFVGRQYELAEVRRLLRPYPKSRHHLVTIDGIGGIGKSALALELACAYRDEYAAVPETERFEAIVWVSAKRTYLTAEGILERRQAFRTLDDLYAAIAQVLDFPAITRARADEQRAIVEQVLSEQRTLLILDNLETVDDEDLLVFLRELPDPTKAIVTTRHRIDVAYPVRLMGMPEADAQALACQEAARKQVTLSDDETADLVKRTGGVPLAIVWSIGLMGLGGSVESVLRRLGSGQSDIAHFCFAESVARIRGRDAHSLLMALALFASDASREALGIVAGLGEDEFGRDEGLAELLRLSLVNKEGERFSLLPLTRVFVMEEAADSVSWLVEARKRWIHFYTDFVAAFSGWSEDWRGHDRVELELPNIFGVFTYLVATLQYQGTDERAQIIAPESFPQAQQLLQLFDRVARTCRIRGYWSLIESQVETALRISRSIDDTQTTGWLCYILARIHYYRGDTVSAKRWALEMRDIGQRSLLDSMNSRANLLLGLVAIESDQLDDAAVLLETALQFSQRVGGRGESNIRAGMGKLAQQRGCTTVALACYQHAVEQARQFNVLPKLAAHLLGLGSLLRVTSDFVSAREYLEESQKVARECGWVSIIGSGLYELALLDEALGRHGVGHTSAIQALELFRRLGMKREQAEAEALLARLEAQRS